MRTGANDEADIGGVVSGDEGGRRDSIIGPACNVGCDTHELFRNCWDRNL